MKEQFIRWNPIDNLNKSYQFESITDERNTFKIILAESSHLSIKVQLMLEGSAESYTLMPINLRQQTISSIIQQYGENFYIHGSFFKVQNSSYLAWLSQQSGSITDYFNFTHYSIITTDYIIDLADRMEPVVYFLSN